MILDKHYAVVFRPAPMTAQREMKIMTENAWQHLQALALEGHFVILECWEITKGKCVSN
jgi:hypothetical protein